MPEPSSHRSEHKAVTIALIGAAATVVAALIGLAPTLFGPRPDAAPPADRAGSSGTKEDPRPAVPSSRGPAPGTVVVAPKDEPRPPLLAVPAPAAPQTRPPLTVSHRPSKLPGQGMVIGLTNAADKETLKNVVVSVRSASDEGERSRRVARSLRPNQTLSVGWRELNNWALKPGDRVRITVAGYAAPVETVVPRR